MPLYNGELFLDQAIKSVVAQTFPNWELIIVDDGSKDQGLERAKYWVAQDNRITVFHHPGKANKGVSATRNLAITHAKGQYLALLDCDDKWLPDKLQIQVEVLQKYPDVAIIYSKAEVIDGQNNVLWQHPESAPKMERPLIFGSGIPNMPVLDFKKVITNEFWLPASSVLMSKTLVNECNNFNENLKYQVEDSLLFLQIIEKGAIYFIDKVLVQYRIHPSQWNAKLDFFLKWKSLFACYSTLFTKISPTNYNAISTVIIHRVFKRFLQQCLKNGRRKSFKFLLKALSDIYKCKYIVNSHKYKASRMAFDTFKK